MLPDRHCSGYTVRAMGKVTAAHLLVRTLKRHGIERLFGLCGDHVNSIFNACIDEGVAIVDTRQESGAPHTGDGRARARGGAAPGRRARYAALPLREAVSGRPGPVHLTIPSDVSEAIVDDADVPIPPPWQRAPAPPPTRSLAA